MSCSNYDWKAYALGELDSAVRRDAEAHASTCATCREELAGLRLTLDTLSVLRDEEVPRRIAFVSDKVFEPRWWQRLWSPAFAGACVVAAAIVVHGFARPPVDNKAIQAQVDAAVTQAVAQVEAREALQREQMFTAYDLLSKQFRQVYKQTSGLVLQ
jgi:anti-sigma factor RsiW